MYPGGRGFRRHGRRMSEPSLTPGICGITVGGNRLDIAFWLPSLRSEGGPSPETVLTDAAGEAAVVSGFFAARAGLGPIPKAPHVCEVQRRQLTQALPWVCRELSLSPPFAVP